jgi:hypothetical protein
MNTMRALLRSGSVAFGLGVALFACSSAPSDGPLGSGSSALTIAPGTGLLNGTLPIPGVRVYSHLTLDSSGVPLASPTAAGTGALGANSLQSAYAIPTTLTTGATIAIVDAFDYPEAGGDLEVYRSNYGIPSLCANGCFQRVNQNGETSSYPSPAAGSSWLTEEALDLDMASVACPSCNIILVEANSSSNGDLDAAVNTAASMGATVISMSWGGSNDDESALNHPGIGLFAASGDGGYGVQFPAGSPLVTAVGGTVLTAVTPTAASPRGWTETAWNGAGSGCTSESKPSWQKDTGCGGRTIADVSAVASGNSPVAVYYGGSWYSVFGTSAATPLVAGIYAFTGNGRATGQYSYANLGAFNDVTSGSNGSCGGSYLCTAGAGYDGPTGNGTPNASAMAGFPAITSISPTSGVNSGGTQVTIVGARFNTSGGTQVTFGGAPAAAVSCPSTNLCYATTPVFGELDIAQTVDVQVTVASNASPTGLQDKFTFDAGPACTSAVSCAGVAFGFPNLVVDCPSTVDFYRFAGTSSQTLLGTGTSYSVQMDDVPGNVGACVPGGSCTDFSTFEISATYCGTVTKEPPPSTCDGRKEPTSACSAGWRCCGTDGWHCGLCE